ncbi:MAG: hypothetical protein WCJ97_04470 [Phycisphaerae bacterium]
MLIYATIFISMVLGLWLVMARPVWYPAFYLTVAVPIISGYFAIYTSRDGSEGVGGVSMSGANINLYTPLIVTSIFGCIWHLFKKGIPNNIARLTFFSLLGFFAVGVIKAGIALADGISIFPVGGEYLRNYGYYFFALWVIVTSEGISDIIIKLRNALFLSPLATLAISILTIFSFGLGGFGGMRFCSASSALLMLMGALGMVFLWKNHKKYWWRMPLLGIYVIMVLIADHRSVWLAGIAAMIFFTIMNGLGLLGKNNGFTRVVLPLIGVLGLIGVFMIMTTSLGDSIFGKEQADLIRVRAQAITDPDSDGTAAWRQERWEYLIARAEDYWVLGMPAGTHAKMSDAEMGKDYLVAHNMYVDLYIRMGAVSVVFYALILFGFIYGSFKILLTRKYAIDEYHSVSFCLMAVITGHSFYMAYNDDSMVVFVLFMGAAAVYAYHSRMSRNKYVRS